MTDIFHYARNIMQRVIFNPLTEKGTPVDDPLWQQPQEFLSHALTFGRPQLPSTEK